MRGTIDTTPDGEKCPVVSGPTLLSGGAESRIPSSPDGAAARLPNPDYRPTDYRDWFEWIAQRIPTPNGKLNRWTSARSWAAACPARVPPQVFEINDNRGRDWRFAPANGRPRMDSAATLIDDGHGYRDSKCGRAARDVALSAVKTTDVLSHRRGAGSGSAVVTLDPRVVSRRAAWYSLGFLLRERRREYLQIQTSEFDVGLRLSATVGGVAGQVFLPTASQTARATAPTWAPGGVQSPA